MLCIDASRLTRILLGTYLLGAHYPHLLAQAPNASPAPLSNISGSVSDASTHRPLEDVRVNIHSGNGDRDTRTDANGGFSIDMAPGSYRVSVEKEGYAHFDPEHSRRLTVAPGITSQQIHFAMNRESVISGHVLDRNKTPLVGERLSLWSQSFETSTHSFRFRGYAITDDRGEFRIAGLPGGKYYLAATPTPLKILAPKRSAGSHPATSSEITTFYPSSASIEDAAALDIRRGEERDDVNIITLSASTFCVTARVPLRRHLSTSQPQMGLRLAQRSNGIEIFLSTARVAITDTIEICNVPPGSYVLEGVTPWNSLLHADVAVDRHDVDLGVLDEETGRSISGTISIDGNHDSATVPQGIRVRAEPTQGIPYSVEEVAANVTDTGAFVVPYVFPGRYWMKVYGLGSQYYVKTIRNGALDFTNQPIAADGSEVSIILGVDPSSVVGVLLDDNDVPTSGSLVVLAPLTMPSDSYDNDIRIAEPDQNGAFRIDGIPPGKYIAFTFGAAQSELLKNPTYLSRFRSEGQEIDCGPNQSQTIHLRIRSADR